MGRTICSARTQQPSEGPPLSRRCHVEGRGPSIAEVATVRRRNPHGATVFREGRVHCWLRRLDLGAAGACSRGCWEVQRPFCVTAELSVAARMSAHQSTCSELGSAHAVSGTQRCPPRIVSLERETHEV